MAQCERAATTALAAVLALGTPLAAHATEFELVYDGYFTSLDTLGASTGPAIPFSDGESFTATALFDTSSPNLVAPIGRPGFVDYAPTSLSLTVGGTTYSVAPYNAVTNPAGLSVAIFDSTSGFGPPSAAGDVAVGLIQNPLQDGAGFVGDWTTGTPPFTASSLTDTAFLPSDFVGVGITSGVCIHGAGPKCTMSAITPISLTAGGQSYLLTLSSDGIPHDITYNPDGTPLEALQQSASLTQVPEPASISLLAVAMVALGLARRRKAGA